jgi:hypothetical protein
MDIAERNRTVERDSRVPLFDCPVCRSNQFAPVQYRMSDGTLRRGSFYRCAKCDFGFTDPAMFSALRQHVG